MSTYARVHTQPRFWALAVAIIATAAILATACGTSNDPGPGGTAGAPPGTNANGGAATGAQITLPSTGTPKVGGKLVYGTEARIRQRHAAEEARDAHVFPRDKIRAVFAAPGS